MARNPNDLKQPEQFIDQNKKDVLKQLPVPQGKDRAAWNAEIDSGAYYANVKVYVDGRRVVEWYKYGEGGGPGNPDPIATTSEDVVPSVKEEWDKDTAKAEADAPPTRDINGVPHERGPDGIYRPVQTEAGPATRSASGTGSQIPADAVPRIEGTPLPGGGFDNEQPVQVWRRPDGTVVKTEPLTPAERKQWDESREKSRNPGGKTDAQLAQEAKDADARTRQAAADARAAAVANKPGAPTLKPDGKGGSIAVQVMPDGTIKSTPLPNIPSEATRITVDGVVYEKGPDGSFAPAKGIPMPGATSKNVDAFTPDPGQPDLGVGAWAAAQRAKIGQPSEAGGITQSEYDQAAKAAHDQASVYIQNVTSSQAVRRQAEQDERGQRKDLSEQAAGDYGRAQGVFSDILQYTKPGSRAIMDVIPGLMAEQAKYRQQREATARPATPLHPMFQALPVQAGVAPAAPPAAPPVAPETVAPPAPQPDPMAAQAAAAAAQAQAEAQATAVPAPPVRDDYRVNPGATPVNPPAGQPGHNPNAPVGMTPGPVSGWAAPMVAPVAPAMAPAGRPVLALQQPPAAPAFDPMDTAGRMARMGVPADAIAQALAELGMTA